jgi:hypothetical protein
MDYAPDNLDQIVRLAAASEKIEVWALTDLVKLVGVKRN